MSCPVSFYSLKAIPSLLHPKHKIISSKHNLFCISQSSSKKENIPVEPRNDFKLKSNLVIPAAILASVAEPAFAVTGVNNQEDLISVLIQVGFVSFWYFLIMPPIILNWLRIRWYRRKLLEMYVQFMFVFLFFPGMLIWAPFMNFRMFPRDPTLKYPWSKPENPSEVKNGFYKYPWATIEDYE